MKKRKILANIGFAVILNCSILTVFAASSSIKLRSNKASVIVGSSFSVTTTLSASEDTLGTWEYSLNYDSSLFKLTSGTNPVVDFAQAGVTNTSYSYSFKCLKSGTGTISVKSYDILGMNSESSLSPSVSGATVKCLTQAELEATYSANANLKSLSIEGYELTPVFDKEILEYNIELENSVTMIKVLAEVADSRSNIVGGGDITLTEGPNRIEIIVTAQKGNTKTYVINANVKELDPINIKVDGKEYKLIRKADQLDTFSTFVPKVITYEGNDIPALYNAIVKYTIVGAKDEAGNKYYFRYDAKAKTFIKYQELNMDGIIFYPLTTNKKPDNKMYKPVTVIINNIKINGYKMAKNSEFALVYGINIENNQEGFYLYDGSPFCR